MKQATVGTTDEEIDALLERDKNLPEPPSAISAEYDQRLDLIVLKMDTGRRLVIPREEMQGLEDATPAQIEDIQIFGGRDISWPQLDLDHYLLYLLEGRYSTELWKQKQKEEQRQKIAA